MVAAEVALDDFHARFSARSRSYRYRVRVGGARSPLEARRELWWPRPVDAAALQAAAALLGGQHDFRAFTPAETQHRVFTRDVHAAAWQQDGRRLDFTITADSFLRHMVRTLVGTMLEASSGGARSAWRSCSRAVRARKQGSRPRPGVCTSSTSTTSALTLAGERWLRSPRALPHRPLRPRRHADRLGTDHPRLDAARGTHRPRPRDPARRARR